MSKGLGVHDQGITDLVSTLWKDDRYHLRAVETNVEYSDFSNVPNRMGEIDVLAFYHSHIGIYEVKSNYTNKQYKKAQDQLMRAALVFRQYHPKLFLYIAKSKKMYPI